jgi:FkbM family methyltransferase
LISPAVIYTAINNNTLAPPANCPRYIVVDVGARGPFFEDSFLTRYFSKLPLSNSPSFDIYSFECDEKYHDLIRSAKHAFPPHTITLVPDAAYIREGNMTFSGNMGHLHLDNDTIIVKSSVNKKVVKTIDFSEWLRLNVKEADFVVVKLDVEGAEYAILNRLVDQKTICLIDELFVEVHFNRKQRLSNKRQRRTQKWADVRKVGHQIDATNTYYHLWF